ncbi:MAG: 4-alpha-glucanotransferase [Cyanobacteria bacterium]|nr:4-alpha-glucanotransferase [Cyanobacteriota bacterium]
MTATQTSETNNTLASPIVATEWQDVWGKPHQVPTATLESIQSLLAATNVATSDQQILPSVLVWKTSQGTPKIKLCRTVTAPELEKTTLFLSLEGETPVEISLAECVFDESQQLNLPTRFATLPPGYHTLSLFCDSVKQSMSLIVTPGQCFLPEALTRPEGKLWGPTLQLYALNSTQDSGIGDFGGLQQVIEWAGQNGAGFIGLNPLHALFPHNPAHYSPYSPSSLAYFNPLYLSLKDIPEVQEPQESINSNNLVDYPAVSAQKLKALRLGFDSFKAQHLASKTPRGKAFLDYCQTEGNRLMETATFFALQDFLYAKDPMHWGWPVWPAEYRDCQSETVQAFAGKHRSEIQFYQYLQWLLHEQLSQLKASYQQHGLPLGLYFDLAVGSDIGGADVWRRPQCYALNMAAGAPPDELNQKGQNWGLPPWIPTQLQASAYQPFIEMVSQNMRYAGALRLDHVMGLLRLFWIPQNAPDAGYGAYVSYPIDDLLGILALESVRNECVVIGEDLGTVPPEMAGKMRAANILSYKVFYFEKNEQQQYHTAKSYTPQAMVTVSTHDLPTLQGFWLEKDIEIRTQLNLYPSESLRTRQINERQHEKANIALLCGDPDLDTQQPLPLEAVCQLMKFLGQSPSYLQAVQMEDIFGQTVQMNVPGTVNEHPNWQYRLEVPIEDWGNDPRVQAVCQVLRQVRPRK